MLTTKFYIIYDLGIHHLVLCVSDRDFYRLIDELSSEFEILKFENNEDGKLVTSYVITDYIGNPRVIGFSRDEEN